MLHPETTQTIPGTEETAMIRAFLLMILLAGCATSQSALAASGQLLIATGQQFVALGAIYSLNCPPTGPKLVKFCAGFKAAAPQFQQDYAAAVASWKVLSVSSDTAKASAFTVSVTTLAAPINALAVEAVATAGAN